MPRTFSITTKQGRRTSTARTMWCHRPDRVSGASPARWPATERSLTGETRGHDADLRRVVPVHAGHVAEVGHLGPVAGEDLGGAGVDLGVPGQFAAESGLDTEVESAVSGAETPDQPRTRVVFSGHGAARAAGRVPCVRGRARSWSASLEWIG